MVTLQSLNIFKPNQEQDFLTSHDCSLEMNYLQIFELPGKERERRVKAVIAALDTANRFGLTLPTPPTAHRAAQLYFLLPEAGYITPPNARSCS